MNKKDIILLAVIAATALVSSCKSSKDTAQDVAMPQQVQQRQGDAKSHTNTLIIMYDAEVGSTPLLEAAKEYGAEVIYRYANVSGVALRIPAGNNLAEAIRYFKAVKGVLSVSQDRQWRLL